ncbi:MAG: hypothetical protein N2111_06265, partial [Candidatus Sumerlaeaceae bacterium]|nr:hypothetical protein [Candidatus Sumerlaeaceae bacterium]
MPIYDQTFRHYDGPRQFRALWWPIAKQTVRPLLKTRFTWALLICILGILIFISIGLFSLAKLRDLDPRTTADMARVVGTVVPIGSDLKLNTLFHAFAEWTGMLQWLLVLLAQGTISADKKHNALPLYFSRPLTGRDYIIGKVLGLALLPATAVLAGTFLIFVQAAAYVPNSFTYAASQLPALLIACSVATFRIFVVAMTMAAFSSVTSNSRTAGVFYIGFWLITKMVGDSLWMSTGDPVFGALSPSNSLMMLSIALLGVNWDLLDSTRS